MEVIRHCSESTDRYLLDDDKLVIHGELQQWLPDHVIKARDVLADLLANLTERVGRAPTHLNGTSTSDGYTFKTASGSISCPKDGPYLSMAMLILITYIQSLDRSTPTNTMLDDESSESS